MELTIDGKPYVSAQRAALELGKSIGTLFRAAKEGAFKATNIHGAFVDEAEFQAWKEKEATKKAKSSN